ncbi:amidase [Rhodocollybia butyracea]|uniref:Amidase n=1 Tax=Rhodocollybia butyracea TaxID=206335 RepID=A0A9P5PM17_9AGAR|nr:amidase [Rhodocollybia butyracea]
MSFHNLHRLNASEALQLIRDDRISVEQYAKSLLNRIQERDDQVQAWAYLDPELVLSQARSLDSIPKEQRGPLHGLAVGVKDIMYTKDMPTEHNSPIYRSSFVQIDASPVMTLRKAGALIFGKTTTTEFASITVGSKTHNPHDYGRTPGGSSSGSGAAVADMQVPFALGTQTAGSIIRPGSFNGIFGFKPTWGAISREGVRFCSINLDTVGFYARSVQDLQLIADVFRLSDDEDPEPFTVRGAKFALCKTKVWPQAGPGTVQAMEKATELLRSAGAEVEELVLPEEFNKMQDLHAFMMGGDVRVAFLGEYTVAKDSLDDFMVRQVENASKMTRRDQLNALDTIASLRPKIDTIAGTYAAILTPSSPDEAPEGLGSTGSAVFNTMWTALHVPAINIPGFSGGNGLPVGLTLIAPRYKDRYLLNVSEEVGKIFKEGGWASRL